MKARFIVLMIKDFTGDRPLAQYSSDDITEFRKQFRALPSKYAQAKPWCEIYKEKGPAAVVAAAGADYDGTRISDKTWNRVYSAVNGFFNWAKKKGATLASSALNPCEDLYVQIPKYLMTPTQIKDGWHLYDEDELTTIFTSPKFLGCTSASRWGVAGPLVFRDHRYWMTAIYFLHGMRREEPAVLRLRHVKCCKETGIWYFDLMDPELRRLLKDVGSPRVVPLHWKLLAIGFLEARVIDRDGDEALFPEAASDAEIARKAGPYGSWFSRFLDECGITRRDIDVHASRHGVIDQLDKRKIKDRIIEAIVGHRSTELRSAVDSYRQPRKLNILKRTIGLVDIPIDVTLFKLSVERSDAIDKTAAWPNLSARRKWRKRVGDRS